MRPPAPMAKSIIFEPFSSLTDFPCNTSRLRIYLSIKQSNKGFCLSVCGIIIPERLNIFLLAPAWSRGGYRQKKIRIQNPFLRKSGKKISCQNNYKIILQKSSNFHLKNRGNNFIVYSELIKF